MAEVVAAHATATLDLLDPGGVQRINTWVFPADHANAHTMLRLFGLEAWSDSPGGVAVQLWPSPGNIARLGPVVTRAVACGVRSALAWPSDRAPTLADHLAAAGWPRSPSQPTSQNRDTHPPHPPWAAPFTAADDWDDVLATVAATAGIATFAALPVNVYGVVAPAGDIRLPAGATPVLDAPKPAVALSAYA